MTADFLPEAPPLLGAGPCAGGRLGSAPDDFVVDEIPLYVPSGSGEHWYVRVQKRERTTPELVQLLAKIAGVRERDIGYAGLKDKHAVTRQWLSLPKEARPPESWELPSDVELLEVSKHGNKLRTGHLTGNRFEITLSDVPEGGQQRASEALKAVATLGLPNYFGEQRFGIGGRNLDQALQWAKRPPARNRKKSRFHEKLYPSVLQAEVFNRYLTRRFRLGAQQLIEGEVVRLSGAGSVFVVEDVTREQPRLERADLVLTGPIFGPRAVAARGQAAELEAATLAELSLDAEALARVGKAAHGTRRDLLVTVEELSLLESADSSLRVRFALPAGSYATQLIRELTGAEWLSARANGS